MPADPVDRARTAIGTPFRLQGRDPATGLDCVGLVAFACAASDCIPAEYALRDAQDERWIAMLDDICQHRTATLARGDIVLMRAGPAQLHLGLWTGAGLIHADARLRRVVETPAPLPWPIIAAWHAPQGN